MPALFTARAAARETHPQRVAARFSPSASPAGPRRRSQSSTNHAPMPASTSPPSRLGRGPRSTRAAPAPRSREAQVIRVVRAAIIRLWDRETRTPFTA